MAEAIDWSAPVVVETREDSRLRVQLPIRTRLTRAPDAPPPDEIVVVAAAAARGRLRARCGGLSAEDVIGEDGLA